MKAEGQWSGGDVCYDARHWWGRKIRVDDVRRFGFSSSGYGLLDGRGRRERRGGAHQTRSITAAYMTHIHCASVCQHQIQVDRNVIGPADRKGHCAVGAVHVEGHGKGH